MMADHFIRVAGKIAEPGATPEMIDASKHVLMAVEKLPFNLALSAIMNAVAITLCCQHGEVKAKEVARSFGRELQRCIEVNHQHFQNKATD